MSETEKTFPIMVTRKSGVAPHPLSIPWSIAELAYSQYAINYGRSQSLERLAERGGFGACEMDMFLPGWRDTVSELTALRTALADARRQRDEAEKREAKLREGVQAIVSDYPDSCGCWIAAKVLPALTALLAPAPEVTDGA